MKNKPDRDGRWRRWRWVVYGVAGYLLAGLGAALTHPGLAAVMAVATVWVLRRRWWRWRRFRREYLAPTLAAVVPTLGVVEVELDVSASLGRLVPRLARPPTPLGTKVRAWYGRWIEPILRWAPDTALRGRWWVQRVAEPVVSQLRRPREDEGTGRITLKVGTPYLTSEQRTFVAAVMAAKIPAGETLAKWNQVGPSVRGMWTVRRRPPGKVGAAEVRTALATLQEWEFYLGATAGGKPVVVSLRDDSPHIACSAGSGAGKSVLAMLVGTQVLARGGRLVILDRKGSHRWARTLSRVGYCTQPEQMHDALVDLAGLADQRNQQALYEEEDWDPGERVLVLAEELNGTISQLQDFWAEMRDKSDPKLSPAIRGLRELLFMGRSAKIHVFGVAQMLSARAIGGPEARENFGIRALARYSSNAWKMLVPEASMPRASRTLGRWQVVVAGQATETQVAYLSPREARSIAGVPDAAKVPDRPSTSDVPGDGASIGDIADPLTEQVTLREAVDEGLLPWRYEAAKKRLQRTRRAGGPAPTPVGKRGLADLYTRGQVIIWAEAEKVPES